MVMINWIKYNGLKRVIKIYKIITAYLTVLSYFIHIQNPIQLYYYIFINYFIRILIKISSNIHICFTLFIYSLYNFIYYI
jgi:hypothetical protein